MKPKGCRICPETRFLESLRRSTSPSWIRHQGFQPPSLEGLLQSQMLQQLQPPHPDPAATESPHSSARSCFSIKVHPSLFTATSSPAPSTLPMACCRYHPRLGLREVAELAA
ncbi:hypothetical protein ACFX2A_039070 [Malus domestica]